jgi:hypothetical protein
LVVGAPSEWIDLIDPMVPMILSLVVATWEEMPMNAAGETEDNITLLLCRRLRQNKKARQLPFQIRPQIVELDPMPDSGEELGRMDIVFIPCTDDEDIYFCLESKRLNVEKGGNWRSYASEYVNAGMIRFITGQYSKAVRHGGMLAYVLDGDVPRAISNVEANIRLKHAELGMSAPGALFRSAILAGDDRARETHHERAFETGLFRIHHLFMANSFCKQRSDQDAKNMVE